MISSFSPHLNNNFIDGANLGFITQGLRHKWYSNRNMTSMLPLHKYCSVGRYRDVGRSLQPYTLYCSNEIVPINFFLLYCIYTILKYLSD